MKWKHRASRTLHWLVLLIFYPGGGVFIVQNERRFEIWLGDSIETRLLILSCIVTRVQAC